MEQDEIRAEIERRRQRAIELKLRETIWAIYKHLRSYAAIFKSDPATIYPGVRETLLIAGNDVVGDYFVAFFLLLVNLGSRKNDCGWPIFSFLKSGWRGLSR